MRKILLALFLFFIGYAQNYAQKTIYSYTLDTNNIRAYISSDGILFNDPRGQASGGFEAPKLPKGSPNAVSSIYSSTLWLGAIDAGNNYHVAAQTYRQFPVSDFRTGPIDPTTGNALPDSLFNDMWQMTKADYLSALSGVETPNLKNWPTSFTSSAGKEPLAPFYDKNNDGMMDVTAGEYPSFPGDEAFFFVYNDDTLHYESQGAALKMEIKGFVYQFVSAENEFLNNTVFVDYYLTNRSSNEYKKLNVGVWTDFDLGDPTDDRVGSDPIRNMYYAYNGTGTDLEYGASPPAMGVIFFNQPMQGAVAYSNDFSPMGNPSSAVNYYNLLEGLWKDGTTITNMGSGYQSGGQATPFMFTGDPCNNSGWTEVQGGVSAGDRRMLGSVGFTDVKPGEVQKVTVAYLWSRSNTSGSIPSLCKLLSQTDSLRGWVNNRAPLGIEKTTSNNSINVYPNPATSQIFVDAPSLGDDILLELYDISGKKVLANTGKSIAVDGLAKGFYILRGSVNNYTFNRKVQIQ